MTAPFTALPKGELLFLDTNTFVYALANDAVYGQACTDLLDRIDQKSITGYTSFHVLVEMAHRLMTIEACRLFGWPAQGAANRLRRHPAQVQQLTLYRQALGEIGMLGLVILPVTVRDVSLAADVSGQTGLLTNDALIVSMMRGIRLSNLASNDVDFDRVPGLTRYAPV